MTTRVQLRRKLAHRMGMPFFRRFNVDNGTASGSGTTTTLIDTGLLKEVDNFWRGQYVYLPATDELRFIDSYTQSTSTLTWLAAIASATSTSQVYEIWSQFTPREVHDAINHVLSEAWPYFFLTGSDETTVIQEAAGLVYTLPTTHTIHRLCQVYLIGYDSETGTVTSTGTNVQLIDSAASFDSDDVGQYITIYGDGVTANGDVRIISAVDSTTQVTVSAAFTQILPVGAKYRKLDKTDTYPGQMLLTDWQLDQEEYPTEIWFGRHLGGQEGHLLRMVYEYDFSELSAEATDTTCPTGFLIPAAMAYLYLTRQTSAPSANDPTWGAMHEAATKAAQLYAQTHRYRHLPASIRTHRLGHSGQAADYPFRA